MITKVMLHLTFYSFTKKHSHCLSSHDWYFSAWMRNAPYQIIPVYYSIDYPWHTSFSSITSSSGTLPVTKVSASVCVCECSSPGDGTHSGATLLLHHVSTEVFELSYSHTGVSIHCTVSSAKLRSKWDHTCSVVLTMSWKWNLKT